MSQSGRSQLKDLLNDLVLQTTEENRETSPFEVDEDVQEAARELLEYSSPRKIHSVSLKVRKARKRSQRNSTTDICLNDEDSYISSSDPIAMYGRKLNQSRLTDSSSLYSVGREWVKNDPYGQRDDEHCRMNMETDSELDLYSLPVPDISFSNSDNNFSPPPQVSTEEMDASMKSANNLSAAQFQSLKLDYMKRWKMSRERCKQRCHVKQGKYNSTIQTLQELYNQR